MADIAGINTVQITMTNPLFTFPVGDDAPQIVNMLVENPKGSTNKFEYVTNTGTIKLDRVLFEQLPFPVEYGAIPQTWDEDEDMLDIISLITYPTFPGCLLSIRPIGVMTFLDSGDVDDKILGVPKDDVRFNHIKDLSDLQEHTIDEISFFFEHYKDLQFKYKKETKKVEVKGWGNKDKAYEVIKHAMDRFDKKFPEIKKKITSSKS